LPRATTFEEPIAGIARELVLSKQITPKITARHLAILGLLAAPWTGFLAIALKPNPRRMWAQRWPTITFVGLYQLALDRCVEIQGLDHIPKSGPVILAGNHINKAANDAMLIGSKILVERGCLTKFVSQSNPPGRVLQHFLRLMGNREGVILPIQKGTTTTTMVDFLRNPEAFGREQAILGIFPAGCADRDFVKHINRPWHTSVAVAACATGASIVPFYIEGLPYHWGPFDMVKAAYRCLGARKPFGFKIRFGAPIFPDAEQTSYVQITERLRQSVLQLATGP
jgi:1-acyl-sn-glycerol-3-phosphate acyltransferase